MPIAAAVVPALIGGGVALAGGAMQAKAAGKVADAQAQAADQSAATQRYIFDQIRADNALGRQAGDAATRQYAALLGINLPQTGGQAATPNALSAAYGTQGQKPWEYAQGDGLVRTGQYGPAQPVSAQAPTNALQSDPTAWLRSTPGYQFNFNEGMRALNLQAGNRGRLNSGAAIKGAIEYGQNYGDRIYGDQVNRLASLAGMGQTANSANQSAATNYGNAMTNIYGQQANALGSSYQGKADAWSNALGGVAGAGLWAYGQGAFGGKK